MSVSEEITVYPVVTKCFVATGTMPNGTLQTICYVNVGGDGLTYGQRMFTALQYVRETYKDMLDEYCIKHVTISEGKFHSLTIE